MAFIRTSERAKRLLAILALASFFLPLPGQTSSAHVAAFFVVYGLHGGFSGFMVAVAAALTFPFMWPLALSWGVRRLVHSARKLVVLNLLEAFLCSASIVLLSWATWEEPNPGYGALVYIGALSGYLLASILILIALRREPSSSTAPTGARESPG